MFSERLKELRVKSGYSQDGLAQKLNVVRQTVSKWERGISVPDAETLIILADILGVSVAELLGEKANPDDENDKNELARQLAKINEELAIKNNRSRKIWNAVKIVLIVIVVIILILTASGIITFNQFDYQ